MSTELRLCFESKLMSGESEVLCQLSKGFSVYGTILRVFSLEESVGGRTSAVKPSPFKFKFELIIN